MKSEVFSLSERKNIKLERVTTRKKPRVDLSKSVTEQIKTNKVKTPSGMSLLDFYYHSK
ncbi:hypothetical protein [Aneurinibacillus tyrosinisolvens]|uniref:hypothetical protein n=1 Tax=Aneurinibacillus tyrosinisolvens TaxID=1443435 RepID=UPI000B00DB21|nr:hypothetical protein [Aneurinibacillus tyrosinisolvens]